MTTTSTSGPAPVRFAQRPDRTLIAGLTPARAVALGVCVLAVAAALTLAGPAAGLITAVGVSPLAGTALLTVDGRALIEWAPIAAHHLRRGAAGQLLFLATPSRPRPVGTLPLPGDAARLRVLRAADGSAIIHDPYQESFTAVAAVHGAGFLYADPDVQDAACAGWGRALAAVAADGLVGRVQVLHTTRPDTAAILTAAAAAAASRSLSGAAAAAYRQTVQQAGPWWRHDALIAITLSGRAALAAIRKAAHHGGIIAGADRVLTAHRDALPDTLAAADAALGKWLTPADLAAWIRDAYDPDSTDLRTHGHPRHGDDGSGGDERVGGYAGIGDDAAAPAGEELDAAGPVAVQESWSRLHTDAAWHTTMWICQWPRADMHPAFLAALVLPTGAATTLSLLYEPIPTPVAVRQMGRDKTAQASESGLRRRLGRLDTAQQAARQADTARREVDLTAGHLDLRHTGLITVTAPAPDALTDAVTRVRQAAAAGGCETRILHGQQLQAFHAAALPLTRGLTGG